MTIAEPLHERQFERLVRPDLVDHSSSVPAPDKFYRRWASEILTAMPAPIVLTAPMSGDPLARWPLESYVEALTSLRRQTGGSVLVVADAAARLRLRGMADSLSFLTSPATELLFAVLERSHLVIANASPVAELAQQAGIPIVTVFGPTMPGETRQADSADLQGAPYCDLRDPDDPWNQPCLGAGRCLRGYEPSCAAGVPPSWVVDAALRLLEPAREDVY